MMQGALKRMGFAMVIITSAFVLGFSTQAEAKGKGKGKSYGQAKKECQSENPDLKGKALKQCISSKRK